MKPVYFQDATFRNEHRDELCPFRADLATINYIERPLAGNGTIRSKGGIDLPTELSLMILEFLTQDAARSGGKYSFVKVTTAHISLNETLLRCVAH